MNWEAAGSLYQGKFEQNKKKKKKLVSNERRKNFEVILFPHVYFTKTCHKLWNEYKNQVKPLVQSRHKLKTWGRVCVWHTRHRGTTPLFSGPVFSCSFISYSLPLSCSCSRDLKEYAGSDRTWWSCTKHRIEGASDEGGNSWQAL